jgi:multidrug efflux pump subunit AcrB
VAPPTVQVSAIYPGVNAQVVADTVATTIEQQVNGVEGMLYMSSTCTNDGQYNLTVTSGRTHQIAQVVAAQGLVLPGSPYFVFPQVAVPLEVATVDPFALTVTFKHGVDLDMAQVLVQNRVNLAVPQLPWWRPISRPWWRFW